MKNNIILMLILYTHLILLTNLNADALEDIKKKNNEIKGEISLFKANDRQNVKRAISHENAGLVDQARFIFEQIFNAEKSSSYIFSNYKNFLIRQEDWEKLIEISREYADLSEGNSNEGNARLALAESLFYVSKKNVAYPEFHENEGYKIIDNLILENLPDTIESTHIRNLKRYLSRLLYYDKNEFAILKINQIRNQYRCVTGAGGGDAEANDFVISSSTSMLLGFSSIDSAIPAGNGTLVILEGDITKDCLSNFIFSDLDGDTLDVVFDGGVDSSGKCTTQVCLSLDGSNLNYVSNEGITRFQLNHNDYPDFYSKKLGKYYLLNEEYEQSLNEFILCLTNPEELDKYINMKNEFNSIRSQFLRFSEEDNVKEIIIKTLTREPSKIKNNILAEYKFNWGDYKEASNLMIKNYFNEKSLYDFAINIMKESQFPSAEKIFNFLMNSNNSEIIELSILQLATILEIKAEKEKIYLPISDRIIENSFLQLKPFGYTKINYKSDELSKAIMMYDSLITKYNNSKARFKIAEFKSIANVNYHESINNFIELEKSATNRSIRFESAIKIIDISIEAGLIDNKLLNLIEKYKKRYKRKEQEDYLNLKRYQVLFYLKNFEGLSAELNDKLKLLNRDNPLYNELLDGITLLMLFNDKENDLPLFSDGLLEIKKSNYPEAINKFNLLSKSKTEIVNNICSYYLGYIYINLYDYNLAEESLSLISGSDIFSELTLLLSAELDDYVIKDINSAVDRYLNFMDQFESSIFYEEIRMRLEGIIG